MDKSSMRVVGYYDSDVLERRRALKVQECLAGLDAMEQTINFVRDEIKRDPQLMNVEACMLLIEKRYIELGKRVDNVTLPVAQEHLEKESLTMEPRSASL